MTDLNIRPARPEDAKEVAPLIFSSGPRAFEFIFSNEEKGACLGFLEDCFARKSVMFSYEHHYVVEDENQVVAIIGAFTKSSMGKTQLSTGIQIIRYLGMFAGIKSLLRGLKFERKIVKPPLTDCYYICHVGVRPDRQGLGIGEKMVAFIEGLAREKGVNKLSLDVSVINPRAQKLYERLGFSVVETNKSYNDLLDDHRYMESML
ncbi:MAG: N-acetyltransferase [Bermanella sp.]